MREEEEREREAKSHLGLLNLQNWTIPFHPLFPLLLSSRTCKLFAFLSAQSFPLFHDSPTFEESLGSIIDLSRLLQVDPVTSVEYCYGQIFDGGLHDLLLYGRNCNEVFFSAQEKNWLDYGARLFGQRCSHASGECGNKDGFYLPCSSGKFMFWVNARYHFKKGPKPVLVNDFRWNS